MVSTAQDIMDRYGIDQDFAASIESLGNDLGVDPMYLANTMYFESTLNPSQKNKAGSGAMGLIQFTPETARNLGTTTDELSRMTPVEQMEYVRRYFSADNLGAGRLRDLRNDPSQHNVNMAVFLPSMIGKPVDTQIARKYWQKNGSIRTPADYTRLVEKHVNNYIQSNPVDKQTDQMLSEEQSESTFRPEDGTVPSDTGPVTSDQAEEEPGFLDTVGEYVGDAFDTVSEYARDAYDTASEYVGETVDTLERVAESVGDKLRRLLGSEEEQQSSTTVDNPPIPERRPVVVDNPPIPKPRPNQTKKSSFNVRDGAEALYSLATTGSRASARKLRDMVAQQLGVYESSQEATSEAKKYGLTEREVDTLRHILGAGLLKYIGKDFTQPLLQGTELFEKIPIYAQRLLDPDSEDTYRKSYYDQSIEEANIDIVNYQVGAALAKQHDTKDDFIKSAVKLVKDLGEGKTPVVVDKMPTRFGLVDKELTPRLSTGVVYPPEELERRNVIYNPDMGTLTAPPVEDYGSVEPAPGSNLEDQGPAVLEKAEGGSVEKEVEFVKEEDDDDVPDPPPGATPEEVADDIPAYLSTGEYVLPANVVRYIGLKNITDMHQRALAELQQMEDLDIIENVDENGYVEEDDDEMDYMKPEGVVEIVVAEHHPKGLMAMGFAEGGDVGGSDPGDGMGGDSGGAYGGGDSSDTGDGSASGEGMGGDSGGAYGGGDTSGSGPSDSSSSDSGDEDKATDPGAAAAAQAESPLGGMVGAINEALGFDPDHGFAGKGITDVDETTGEVFGPMGLQSVARSYTVEDIRDPKSVASAVGAGLGSIAGGLAGIGQAAVNAAVEAGVDVQEASTNDIGGGSQELYKAEDEKVDTGSEKTTDTDPLSDYTYVPGVGYRRKVKSVKPLSKLKDGGYVTRNGIMARGYSEGGEAGDPGGGPGGPLEYEPEPEVIEEEKPTDPYEGYTYVKGIGYVPTSRRMTSDKPVDAASLALSSIFTPGFLETIGLMSDPNKEL